MSDQLINDMEAHLGVSMEYMPEIKRHSEGGFEKFANVFPLAGHREVISKEANFVARILATIKEDCGTCAQIAVNRSIDDGVDGEFINSVIQGRREDLSDEVRLVYDFVQATLDNVLEQDGLREQVKDQLGAAALVDLGLAIASARVFPTVKRTLGFATTCQRLSIGNASSQVGTGSS